MPKVGRKKFSYSPRGMKAANRYARKTGQSVSKGRGRTRPGTGTRQQASPRPMPPRPRPGIGNQGPRGASPGGPRPRMTNRGGARRRPGSGGPRDVGARPSRFNRRLSKSPFYKAGQKTRRGY